MAIFSDHLMVKMCKKLFKNVWKYLSILSRTIMFQFISISFNANVAVAAKDLLFKWC